MGSTGATMEPAKSSHLYRAIAPVFVASVALGVLFFALAGPQVSYAQGGCTPATITVLSTPTVTGLYYADVTRSDVDLLYNGTSLIFSVDAEWTGTSNYVGPTGRVGIQATAYFAITADPETMYTLYVEVLQATLSGGLHNTYSRVSLLQGTQLAVVGTYTYTVDGGDLPSIIDALYLQVSSAVPHDTIAISGIWRITLVPEGCTWPPEEPPEPPQSAFCLDGMEVLSDMVTIPAEGTWQETVDTGWERFWVRYTFTEPNQAGILHRLTLRANDEYVIRQFYSDEVMTYDPETGTYLNDPWWWSVPNRHFSSYADYNPTGFVEGPEADLSVRSGYNPINLVSVCVVPYYGPSLLCPDGIEALGDDGPLYLDALSGAWQNTLVVTATHIVVRYNVENPMGYGSRMLGTPFKFMPGIDYTLYYVQADIYAEDTITFTLPTTGVVKLYDDSLYLEFYNRYWPVILNSVCVIDAAENGYLEQLDAETCHLENPDFVQDLDGWTTDGTVTWDAYEENGVAILDTGQVYQTVNTERSRVWDLEVRARTDAGSGYGGVMDFGTTRTALVDGGMQVDTATLAPYFGIHTNDVYVMPGDYIYVESEDAIIDSVCLVESSSPLGEFDCTFPVWDPEGSGDSLIIYVFHWLGDVLKWVVCEILRGITILFNEIYAFIRDIILRIPMIPDPGSGLISWIEWFQLLIAQFLDWFGFNIPTAMEWFPRNLEELARWLLYLLRGFVFWLAEALGLDPWMVWDTLDLIWTEARLFIHEMLIEIDIETDNALLLLQNTANVLIVLADGVRYGVSGNHVAYIGKDFSGIGGFIWTGVNFINEAVDLTPLSGLNILALGVIAWGLTLWTGKKFIKILESVGS